MSSGRFVKGDPRAGRRPGSKNKLTLLKAKLRADAVKTMNDALGDDAFTRRMGAASSEQRWIFAYDCAARRPILLVVQFEGAQV
jgi:hypothetical protein